MHFKQEFAFLEENKSNSHCCFTTILEGSTQLLELQREQLQIEKKRLALYERKVVAYEKMNADGIEKLVGAINELMKVLIPTRRQNE